MKAVYTLADLQSILGDQWIVDGCPVKLAVIGCPVAHSASPAMHQSVLDELKMPMRYVRIEVQPGQVAAAVSQMRRLGMVGCNVTVPHKKEVVEVCDELTPEASSLGVVNTVLIGKEGQEGKIIGHNTDALGFTEAIKEVFQRELASLRVMVLGVGGGAGRAIATHCAMIGCGEIWLANRTASRAEQLCTELRNKYTSGTITALSLDDPAVEEAASGAELIINATPLGMKAGDSLPMPTEFIQPHHFIYDMVYHPRCTEFIQRAAERGASTTNGLPMLLHQGVLAFAYWFPETARDSQAVHHITRAMREGLPQA
ncbi:MAG: shikimate dehydrogenase [Akkermansiaceae bacterium]